MLSILSVQQLEESMKEILSTPSADIISTWKTFELDSIFWSGLRNDIWNDAGGDAVDDSNSSLIGKATMTGDVLK